MPKTPDIQILNATGHRCPLPVILMERALRRLPAGAALKIIADDPLAAVDIPHFAREMSASAVRLADENGACVFLVTGGGNQPAQRFSESPAGAPWGRHFQRDSGKG